MTVSFAVGVLAVLMLLHAAYQTIQYRALLKITEDEFTGPPYEVLVELVLVLVLSLFAGLTVPGNFRSILPDSDENRYVKHCLMECKCSELNPAPLELYL